MRPRADVSRSNAVDYQSLADEDGRCRREQSVRFGSLAEICSAKRCVRFTPNSGHECDHIATTLERLVNRPTARTMPYAANETVRRRLGR